MLFKKRITVKSEIQALPLPIIEAHPPQKVSFSKGPKNQIWAQNGPFEKIVARATISDITVCITMTLSHDN